MTPHDPSARPRVCHVAGSALTVRELLLDQLRHLKKQGFDVEVAAPKAAGPGGAADAGIPCHDIRLSRAPSSSDAATVVRLARFMRQGRFDIVHTHNPLAGLVGRAAARLAGVEHIVHTVHGWYFEALTSKPLRAAAVEAERLAARVTDALMFQSREDQRRATKLGLARHSRLSFIGNGIDLDKFDPTVERRIPAPLARFKSEGRVIVGFVGRISHPRKGYLDFVRASRDVARRDGRVGFLTIGSLDVGATGELRSAVDRLSSDPNHVVLDWMPNEELAQYYAAMDALVLPSLFEGLPRVVMEAAVMGVPVIVSDVAGNREAKPPGPPNELVPFGDAAQLAEAMSRVIRWSRSHGGTPIESRDRVRASFDQRRVFERIGMQYELLVGGQS